MTTSLNLDSWMNFSVLKPFLERLRLLLVCNMIKNLNTLVKIKLSTKNLKLSQFQKQRKPQLKAKKVKRKLKKNQQRKVEKKERKKLLLLTEKTISGQSQTEHLRICHSFSME